VPIVQTCSFTRRAVTAISYAQIRQQLTKYSLGFATMTMQYDFDSSFPLTLILVPFQATAETPHFPVKIAGLKITRVVDLTLGYDTGNPPAHKPSLPLSLGHMIQLRAESSGGGTKIVLTIRYVCSQCQPLLLNVVIRTSGTEPKVALFLFVYPASCLTLALQIKYYLEGNGTDPTEVGRLLPKVVMELRNTWMEAKKNNLGMH